MDIQQIVRENPILAIMRNVPMEKTIPYAKAIVDGGISFFEVAMNSPNACQQLSMLRKYFGDDVYIGAGTAITIERVDSAISAGAQFLLTPSTDIEILSYCHKGNIPLIPGVMTPSDVGLCYKYGYKILKLFPAGNLPDGYIKSLKAPLDGTDYIAIGGVTPDNIVHFLENGFIGVGLSNAILPKECVAKDDWVGARSYVEKLVSNVKVG